MGSMGNFSNGPRPVEYSSLMKSISSVERMFDGVFYEILVEPKKPQHGTAFRYILEDLPTCPCSTPGKDKFHVNGSLRSRTKRGRKVQGQFQRYTEKSHLALRSVRKRYSKVNFNLSLVKNQISLKDKRNIPEIRLQLGSAEDIEKAKQYCRKGPDGEEQPCEVAESQAPCNISSDSDNCDELEAAVIRGLGDEPVQAIQFPMSANYMLNLAFRSRRQLHLQNARKIHRRIQVLDALLKKGYKLRSKPKEQGMQQKNENTMEGNPCESQQIDQMGEEQNAADQAVEASGSCTEVFLVCI